MRDRGPHVQLLRLTQYIAVLYEVQSGPLQFKVKATCRKSYTSSAMPSCTVESIHRLVSKPLSRKVGAAAAGGTVLGLVAVGVSLRQVLFSTAQLIFLLCSYNFMHVAACLTHFRVMRA